MESLRTNHFGDYIHQIANRFPSSLQGAKSKCQDHLQCRPQEHRFQVRSTFAPALPLRPWELHREFEDACRSGVLAVCENCSAQAIGQIYWVAGSIIDKFRDNYLLCKGVPIDRTVLMAAARVRSYLSSNSYGSRDVERVCMRATKDANRPQRDMSENLRAPAPGS